MEMNDTVIVFATFAAIVLTLHLIKRARSNKKYHPVAGTVFNLVTNFDRFYDYLTEESLKHLSFRFLNFGRNEVYTSDPANIEYFLKTNFQNYGKGAANHAILQDLLGDGIFTVDGEKWKHQRKTSSYEFSTKVLRNFSSGVFKQNASKLGAIVSASASTNSTIQIQDLLMKAGLDSVFKVVLGVELNSLDGALEEDSANFSRCFEEASSITIYRFVDVLWKLKRRLNIGSEARLKKSIKVIDEFVYKIIRMTTEQIDQVREKEDLLSRFLDKNETDPKYLKDIILSFIIAGKDTTASALTWFLYLMCKHPEIQSKVAQEIKKATNIGASCLITDTPNMVTEEALEKMQYLHAALTETLRIYPPVSVDAKVCFGDDTLPDGFSIKKGDSISYIPWAMGRMKSIWGEDAEVFRPERWLDENGIFQKESSAKFISFQAGPRICLGREFAYRQMKIFAATLLGNFSFEMSDEQGPVNYKTMLTLHMDGGLRLKASPRYAA